MPATTRRGGSLLGFFALTYTVSWAFFVTAALLSRTLPVGAPPGPGLLALVLIGTFAPAMVAIALTARAGGGAGVRALLARLFDWQVGWGWYAFAVSYMFGVKLAAALAHRLVTGTWPALAADSWLVMIAATFFSTMIGGQAGEEIGWRGYALPRLAARFGLGLASVMLGAIWATWHLPLYFLHGADKYGQSFPVALMQVTALSVAMGWLYLNTRGSLLPIMLMHAAVNNLSLFAAVPRPPANPLSPGASLLSGLTMALLWIGAGYFLVRMRRARLPSSEAESAA